MTIRRKENRSSKIPYFFLIVLYLEKGYNQGKEEILEQDFEERNRRYQSQIQEFCLMHDTLMSKVFEDKKCTELVLRIILDQDDLIVDHVNCQLDIKNLQGRSIRTDILAA